jgi:hypothetical protein
LADGEQGCLYEVVDLQFVEKFFDAKLPDGWWQFSQEWLIGYLFPF